jgi:response regulator RpfG family c-di-GMP phosphodiesterase
MNSPATDGAIATASPAVVLCVDDEPNITSALKRLFRPEGYKVLTAASGIEGLKLCAAEKIDLVISDMRMPEMDGAQFLEQVRANWPDVMRILLTGYSDVDATVAAVNKGEIHRYVAKPWDDNELLITIRNALDRRWLEAENLRLQETVRAQNKELTELNAKLEALVEQRTGQLKLALTETKKTNEKLKAGFVTSIKVFSNLIELREGQDAGHSRRAADLAMRIAKHLQMEPGATQEIMLAGLLHGIGKIGLPDSLLAKPSTKFTPDELALYRRYPLRGQNALMALEQLQGVAAIVRSHQERFDGRGHPDGLSGLAIPEGARVLAVANDYDNLVNGLFTPKRYSPSEAKEFLQQGSGKRHDPRVIKALIEVLTPTAAEPELDEVAVAPRELRPGMVLTRDLVGSDGVMLLAADYTLDANMIKQIVEYARVDGGDVAIYVKPMR